MSSGPAWVFWVWNLCASVALLAALELGLYACLRFPALTQWLPDTVRHGVSLIYHERDRILIHRHSAWHPLVTYTIKPGTVNRVESREFVMEVRGNSLGLRDDEASLEAPELIVLGDSFSMGYGMAEQETFAAHLERDGDFKVLNAALESYATARQVLTFNRRLDTSGVQRVIVQYCDNDVWENLEFLAHGGELPTRSAEDYWGWVERVRRSSFYRPFRYLRDAGRALLIDLRPAGEPVTPEQLELHHVFHAQAFLRTLSYLELPDSSVELVAFDLWDHADMRYLRRDDFRRGLTFDSRLFMQAVRHELREGEYPEFLKTLQLIDTSMLLEPEDSFQLDGHIRASGHAKIADALRPWLAGEALPEIPPRSFLTSAEDRRGQLLTAPLSSEGAKGTLECPAQVAIEGGALAFEVRVSNESGRWWPAYAAVPGLDPVHITADRGGDPDSSLAEPICVVLPRAMAPGEQLSFPVRLHVDAEERELAAGDVWRLELAATFDGAAPKVRWGESRGASCEFKVTR